MGKTLSETPISTRAARAALAEGVHWRSLDPEVHLGYRRGKRGGRWLVRWRSGTSYKQATIGTANDVIKVGTLSFEAAVTAALEHFRPGLNRLGIPLASDF